MSNTSIKTVFVQEQKRYTQDEICNLFSISEEKAVLIIKKLKEYGVLKTVNAKTAKSLTDLVEEDIVIADVVVGDDSFYHVFTFVGVMVVFGIVIKSYPKYLKLEYSDAELNREIKRVIQVLDKYNNSKEQIISFYNDNLGTKSFNLLAVTLFLIKDYFDYGLYTNQEMIIETNGDSDIVWDRTINETYSILSNGRPYYVELKTRKRVDNEFDYIRRIHKYVLNRCNDSLKEAALLDVFDLIEIDVPDEDIDVLGDKEYILYKIEQEIATQFNTHKQLLLKTLYSFIAQAGGIKDVETFSIFGTTSYNLVWEEACKVAFNSSLNRKLSELVVELSENYKKKKNKTLIELIDKPIWKGKTWKDGIKADKTLIPDLISVEKKAFRIFDAKYYNLRMEANESLSGNPGIESITKQYLYQVAYQDFVKECNITTITNAFLFPTDGDNCINNGIVSLEMMQLINTFDGKPLKPIQVILLPAKEIFNCYLKNISYPIEKLELDNEGM